MHTVKFSRLYTIWFKKKKKTDHEISVRLLLYEALSSKDSRKVNQKKS